MKKIAIIPARGGSKRIPKKNIKNFLGKPIIAYSIEAALKSKLFDEVMVSTDDPGIAKVAKKYGAEVPFMRSKKNSNDHAVLADVVEEVIERYLKNKKKFDFICCILPTAPLIKIRHLKDGLKMLLNGDFDSVRPIVKFSYPIQRALKFSKDNKVAMFYPEYMKTRSQDLVPAYHDAGQFYWMNFKKRMKGKNRGAFVISDLECQDIDNMEDWKIAEIKYKQLK